MNAEGLIRDDQSFYNPMVLSEVFGGSMLGLSVGMPLSAH